MNSILIITSETFPSSAGDGRSAFYLASETTREGTRCDILSLKTKTNAAHEAAKPNQPSLFFIRYFTKTIIGKIWSRLLLISFLITKGKRYNTWLIYGKTLGNRIALLLGKILGKTTIFRPTLLGFDDLNTLSSKSIINKNIYRLAKGYWALNPTITKSITNQGIKTDVIFKSPQGAPNFFAPALTEEKLLLRKKLNLPDDKLIITMVGHIIRRKGFPQVFKQLSGIAEDFLLVVVGTNCPTEEDRLFHKKSEMKTLMKEGIQLLGPRIQFTGRVFNVAEYLKAADIFLHAATREGFPPNALNEAMATELPCLVKYIEGIPLEDYSDSIMIYRTEEELAEKISQLLQSKPLRDKMGKNAYCFAQEHLNLSNISEQLQHFITTLEKKIN